MKSKRGSSIGWGLVIMFVALVGVILLGVGIYGFNLTNSVLSQDIDLGNGVNLKDISEATFGKVNTGLIENGDTIGIVLLFGMCLFMIVNGYFFGEQYPKLFILIDLVLLVLFFIPASYISSTYETFINIEILSSTFIDILPKTSKFVLNLPLIMGTVGIITMILTYAGIKKKGQDDFLIQEF